MSGVFLKGALIEMAQTFIAPVPNVIVFQFNPEKIEHSIQQGGDEREGREAAPRAKPQGVPGNPTESFSFTLVLDAADVIARHDPAGAPLAVATGVATRIAALEMLLFPVRGKDPGLLGSVLPGVVSRGATAVPASELPTVLFVWGPGRVVPVRVTSLTVSETLYDAALNPTHAEASISLEVIRPEDLGVTRSVAAAMARGAYGYTHTLRQALAIANHANAVGSVIGALPV